MELERFLKLIKGEIMSEKEIRIKAISRKDATSGPMISMMDAESIWYSVFKSNVTDDTWDILKELKDGDVADITWTSTVSKTGGKTFNNLTGFSKVLRLEDEVKDVPAPKSLPGETPPPKFIVPETGARQTCLNCAVQIVAIWIEKDDSSHVDSVIAVAKQLYAALKETW